MVKFNRYIVMLTPEQHKYLKDRAERINNAGGKSSISHLVRRGIELLREEAAKNAQ